MTALGIERWTSERAMDGGGPQLGDLLSMGVALAVCVVTGFGLGWLADSGLGTSPALALVGLALGVVAAGFYAYRQFRRYL